MQRKLPIRTIIAKMRRDGCGGRPGRVELLGLGLLARRRRK
jgi:hypothetical protein